MVDDGLFLSWISLFHHFLLSFGHLSPKDLLCFLYLLYIYLCKVLLLHISQQQWAQLLHSTVQTLYATMLVKKDAHSPGFSKSFLDSFYNLRRLSLWQIHGIICILSWLYIYIKNLIQLSNEPHLEPQ